MNTGTRLTLVTECSYIFNYKDHWESRIVYTITRIFLIQDYIINFLLTVSSVVYFDQLMLAESLCIPTSSWLLDIGPAFGCLVFNQHWVARYCISRLANRCLSCTHISYHNTLSVPGSKCFGISFQNFMILFAIFSIRVV